MSFKTRLLTSYQAGSGILNLARFNQFDACRYPYLLTSSASRQNNTQFDVLFACPQYSITLNSDKTLIISDDTGNNKQRNKTLPASSHFFQTLEQCYKEDSVAALSHAQNKDTDKDADLPFTGGWFVYLSYEMAAEIEPCLKLLESTDGQPLAVAARCPAAIIHDKKNKQLIALAEEGYEHLLDELEQDYLGLSRQFDGRSLAKETIALQSLIEADSAPYLQQVEKIKQYIIDGDIFQANLSRQWQAILKDDIDDATLFATLSKHTPSSFAAMACLKNMTIISSSPERLVSLKNGIVETRPIAGTRPRDEDQASDDALADELLSHPKEQAEHIMLIDLERNDLGRVCRPGSIEVNELMVLESWEHVHHIVSNVRGELDTDKSPIDVLRAVFPGGTITGCPKIHCIEILAEMEQQARGAYTGSLGYINNDGSMDFNILIRTMVRDKQHDNNKITFRAGGGIVSDSVAAKELEETRAKAKGLLKTFHLDE